MVPRRISDFPDTERRLQTAQRNILFPDSEYFFPDPQGQPYSNQWLLKIFKHCWRNANSDTIDGDGKVYTDPKLLVFILKQLLINCAKYCPDCRVHMELSENSLLLADNGPGIPAHELRRVTERGFTGSAGRARGESTGMGLYIVSRLCQSLNIQMEISSREGQFTRFVFRFPAPTLQNC